MCAAVAGVSVTRSWSAAQEVAVRTGRVTILFIILLTAVAFGQQKDHPTPVTYKLGAEASKRWTALDKDEQEFIKQANFTIQQYESHKNDLCIGANIPEDARQCVVVEGTVICSRTEKKP
jgi:hypothetical protein